MSRLDLLFSVLSILDSYKKGNQIKIMDLKLKIQKVMIIELMGGLQYLYNKCGHKGEFMITDNAGFECLAQEEALKKEIMGLTDETLKKDLIEELKLKDYS